MNQIKVNRIPNIKQSFLRPANFQLIKYYHHTICGSIIGIVSHKTMDSEWHEKHPAIYQGVHPLAIVMKSPVDMLVDTNPFA